MSIPLDRKYTRDHEWIQVEGDLGRVGVTAHAAEELGDVVYIDLPEVGTEVSAGEPVGEIESTKSVSDLVAPASGVVVEVNDAVIDAPDIVNADPYGAGWLYAMRVTAESDLLDADAYGRLLESQA